MKDMITGDTGDHRMHQRAREAATVLAAGVRKLGQLHALLDRPWFRDRHIVSFELQGMGRELTLALLRPGNRVIGNSSAPGDTLVLTSASGTELRAELLDCAVSMTREFLEQTRTGRH